MKSFLILFLLIFTVSACHSNKDVISHASSDHEISQSNSLHADVDSCMSRLLNRNVVVSLKDVAVHYADFDSSMVSRPDAPNIRSPARTSKISIGQITLSENTEEFADVRVKDNSLESSNVLANGSANVEQRSKEEASQLRPSKSSFYISLCLASALFVFLLVVLYRKGKLRL